MARVPRIAQAPRAPICKVAASLASLLVPISSLKFDPANARVHGPENQGQIKASLREFGQLKPVVVAKDGVTVVAGNATLRSAMELGWTHVAAAVTDLDGDRSKAFAIADNQASSGSSWAEDTLAQQLSTMPPELQMATGIPEDTIKDLLATFNPVPAPNPIPIQLAATKFRVGSFQAEIPRDEYERWLKAIHDKVGYATADVVAEIRRLLGLSRPQASPTVTIPGPTHKKRRGVTAITK